MPLKGQFRDSLVYTVIGIGVLAIIFYLAAFEPRVSLSEFHTWFSLAFFTALLAAVLAKAYWPVRRRILIWLLLAAFIAVHTAAFVAFLERDPNWPAFWYIPACTAEAMLFMLIAKLWLNVMPKTTWR